MGTKVTASFDQALKFLSENLNQVCKLESPSEEFLRRLVMKNPRAFISFKPEWKTDAVCDQIVYSWKHNTKVWQDAQNTYDETDKILQALPEEFVSKMDDEDSRKLLSLFPKLAKNAREWAAAASQIENLSDIPEDCRTETVIAAWAYAESNKVRKIPKKYWTDSLARKIVDKSPELLVDIPEVLITKELLAFAFSKKDVIGAEVEDLRKRIPEKAWTKELVDKYVELWTASKNSYDYPDLGVIPVKFRTPEICMKLVGESCDNFRHVPEKLRTREMQIAYYIAVEEEDSYDIKKTALSEFVKFQCQTLTAIREKKLDSNNHCVFDEFLNRHAKGDEIPKQVIPLLKVYPQGIIRIAKGKQTKEMIMTVLENMRDDEAKEIAQAISIARVTADMAPLLMGIDDTTLQEAIARKVKGRAKTTKVVAGAGEIVLDLHPSWLAKLNEYK